MTRLRAHPLPGGFTMSGQVRGTPPRYFALDIARATAMLLGVVYHAIMFVGGDGGRSIAPGFMDWTHSFRMPLFFLISGFFGRTTFGRYGLGDYLGRRWWRIGVPLACALLTFAAIHRLAGAPGRPPGPAPRGDGPAAVRPEHASGMDAGRDLGRPPRRGPVEEGGEPAPRDPGRPRGAKNPLAERLFGRASRLFGLGPLWFLWYLLVFATITPFLSRAVASVCPRRAVEAIDRGGGGILARVLVPLGLGLASVPALMAAAEPSGIGLGRAAGIPAAFPDFLLQYQPDMPFYLGYFLAGWWLHGVSGGLILLGGQWVPLLVLGTMAHFLAMSTPAQIGGHRPFLGGSQLVGPVLYAVGSSCTTFGLVGFFQRHLDRPTRVGRYLTDTSLWIYLVHQEMLQGPIAAWFGPWRIPGLAKSLLAAALATGIALVLYELAVRRTPLARIFGPPQHRRPLYAGAGDRPTGPMPGLEEEHVMKTRRMMVAVGVLVAAMAIAALSISRRPPQRRHDEAGADDLSRDAFDGPRLTVTSPAFEAGGEYPAEFTCDGAGVSPPVGWSGGPPGTRSYALELWHVPPSGGIKSYWLVYDIPADVRALPRGSTSVGMPGVNDKGETVYDPMCSRGPGPKTYHLTVHAMSAQLGSSRRPPTRGEFLDAMRGAELARGTLTFTYSRPRRR
ncbi:MAG: acyltransferase family protein [Isosphaeraceae bacterium]